LCSTPTQRAVVVDPELGNDVQADTRRPRGASLGACQHHVDRVLARTLITGGDEHLRPLDLVDSGIGGGVGSCDDVTRVGSVVGFGETHGPLPFAAHHFGDEHGLVLLCSETEDQVGGPAGELDTGGQGRTGAGVHLVNGLVDGERHARFHLDALAARSPSVLLQKLVRLPEARDRCHDAFFELEADLVAGGVNGADDLPGHLVSLVEEHVHVLHAVGVLEAITGADLRRGEPFLQDEFQISDVVFVFHIFISFSLLPVHSGWAASGTPARFAE